MKARGWLSLCLGWGVGCRKQWEQKSPWGWDRHSVADRYRQAPSRMLSWAKEFKQALNLNREEASPPPHSPPPQQDLAIPFCRATSGCGWPAGPHPCFPTDFCQEPGHPAAGMGGSAPALSSLRLFLSSLLFVSSIPNRNISF